MLFLLKASKALFSQLDVLEHLVIIQFICDLDLATGFSRDLIYHHLSRV